MSMPTRFCMMGLNSLKPHPMSITLSCGLIFSAMEWFEYLYVDVRLDQCLPKYSFTVALISILCNGSGPKPTTLIYYAVTFLEVLAVALLISTDNAPLPKIAMNVPIIVSMAPPPITLP